MPKLIITIVNAGTPEVDTQTGLSINHTTGEPIKPSTAGHMWYTIKSDDGTQVYNYGFAPKDEFEGKPFAEGKPYTDDQSRYQIDPESGDRQYIANITQEEFDKLYNFGEDPSKHNFNLEKYNIFKNSCVDFVWYALKIAGFNTHGFQGDLIPIWNTNNIEALLSRTNDYIFTKLTYTNLHITPSEYTNLLANGFKLHPVDLINADRDFFSEVFGTKISTAINGDAATSLHNSGILSSHPTYLDKYARLIEESDAILTLHDSLGKSYSIIRDDVLVKMSDGSFAPLPVAANASLSSELHFSNFITGIVDSINKPLLAIYDNPELMTQIQGEFLARIIAGDSIEDIATAIAARIAVNITVDQGSAFLSSTTNVNTSSFVTNSVKAGLITFGTSIAIRAAQGETLHAEDYANAALIATTSAIASRIDFVNMSLANPSITNGFAGNTSSAVAGSSTNIGGAVNAGIAAAIVSAATAIVSDPHMNREQYEETAKQAMVAGTIAFTAAAITTIFFPPGTPVAYAVGAVIGAVIAKLGGVAIYNRVSDTFNDIQSFYDVTEDLFINGEIFSGEGLVDNAEQLVRTINHLANSIIIDFPKEVIMGVIDGIFGIDSEREYLPGQYANPYAFTQITTKPDGNGNQIIGLETEGVVAIASEGGNDDIYGTIGNDILIGKDGTNQILGLNGDDHIEGRGGDDILIAADGDDEILAGDGDDYIEAGNGDDLIYGEDGNDRILAGDGDDYIEAGIGNDKIAANAGNDIIYAGNGDNVIIAGSGNDYIEGGDGSDTALGEDGRDIIVAGSGNDIADGGNGNDIINGDDGNDNLKGGSGNDKIFGGNDIDIISGDGGDDMIDGGNDNDLVSGGIGNDIIFGNQGDDSLYGEIGNDYLIGGDGNDILDGFVGDDAFYGGKGDDVLAVGSGNDTYIFLTSDGSDVIAVNDADNDITAVNDTNAARNTDVSNDNNTNTSQISAENDIIRLSDISSDQLTAGKVILVKNNNDLLIQFKDDQGNLTRDQITIKNQFDANNNSTSLIDGIEFSDNQKIPLNGVNGITVNNDNSINYQLISYNNFDTAIQSELALGYQDLLSIDQNSMVNPDSSFYSNNYSSNSNIRLSQTDHEQFNQVQWRAIEKTTDGVCGFFEEDYTVWEKYYEPFMTGTSGNDRQVGNWWNESISGLLGDDNLSGNNGDDYLDGGNGDDILIGGIGNNILIGGAGHDIFDFSQFENNNQSSLVADFSQSEDLIRLANSEYDHISYGHGGADDHGGLEYYFDHENNTIIDDPDSDFMIKLNGHIELNHGDFMFGG